MKKRKNKKYQSVITQRILRSAKKLTAVFSLVACATSLFAIGGTNAGFSDVEESHGNTFVAGSLDGRASYVERFSVTGMNPDQQPDSRIVFRNDGSLDFRYGIAYQPVGGDAVLCDAFLLTVKRNSGATPVYTGLLKDFNVQEFPAGSPFLLASLHADTWDFTVELPTGAGSALENKVCTWNFGFTAWQTDLPDATEGFSDIETVGTHSIATGDWLTPGDVIINEVMWMGAAPTASSDEWIELKNMTDHDIDLSNWDIENGGGGSGHIEIPHGYSIKAHDYFLILNNKWNETAINLTGDLAHDRGYTHVSGMSLVDGGEQLTLEDKDNHLIDQTPTGAWPAGSKGTLKQSMERNDIPGDGTLPANWHTCVSGAANGLPYWDVTGNTFGTPLAANLSPIVLNEFVANPVGNDGADRPAGEWIELYNILAADIDVNGWYFTNTAGDRISVTTANTATGDTIVPGKGTLVAYLERSFLGNDHETLSLFAPGVLPLDPSDDIREDTYSYEGAAALPEGKSFARFPDGEGIWLDPEATPGKDNKLGDKELADFRLQAYDTCFEGEELKKDNTEAICAPLFLTSLGLFEKADETKIRDSVLLEILEMIRVAEEKKLVALLEEGDRTGSELIPTEPVPAGDGAGQVIDEPQGDTEEPVVPPIEALPPVAEPTPVPPTPEPLPIEPAALPPAPIEPLPTPEEPVVPGAVSSQPPVVPVEPPVVETVPPVQPEAAPAPQPEAPVVDEIPAQ